MSRLIIPTRVAEQVAAAAAEQSARVEPDVLTWDRDGIDLADIPDPVGYRILIEPIEISDKVGSILLPESTTADARHLVYVGKVVAVGPDAYAHAKFNGQPWCKSGDYVIYGKYAGQVVRLRGQTKTHTFKFVNDDEILATASDPSKLVIYV